MTDIVFHDDLRYEDLGEEIEVELKLIGSWLYIESPIERKAINENALRYDGTPMNVLDFVLKHAGKTVTIFDLQDAGIKTSRDLRQIMLHAGLKGYIRDLFMPLCEKYQVKLLKNVTLRPAEAEALIEELY